MLVSESILALISVGLITAMLCQIIMLHFINKLVGEE